MTIVPYTILYYPQGDDAMVYEVTEYPYRYLEAQRVRVPKSMMRPSRMSIGLQVRHMAHTTYTPTDLLGDTLVHLLHPKAPVCDGDPETNLLILQPFPSGLLKAIIQLAYSNTKPI